MPVPELEKTDAECIRVVIHNIFFKDEKKEKASPHFFF